MKPLCFTALALLSASAFATTPDEMSACSIRSDLYESAADMRDHGMSPQETALVLGAYQGKYVSAEVFKATINAIYFDSRFRDAGGLPLKRQMLDVCLNGKKPAFQPLK
jgi:hypothetical protein